MKANISVFAMLGLIGFALSCGHPKEGKAARCRSAPERRPPALPNH